MKTWIPHKILTMNEQVIQTYNDEAFLRCMNLAFDWANQMGIKGQRVFDLTITTPSDRPYDPLNEVISVWCKIECTEEQRQHWQRNRELDVLSWLGGGWEE